MTYKKLILIAILFIVIFLLMHFDLSFVYFEDGSFVLTGCNPFAICN